MRYRRSGHVSRRPSPFGIAVGAASRLKAVGQIPSTITLLALQSRSAAMAEFSLATGLRQSNVTHLEWSQVDLGRRLAWIHADQAKGKRDLAVPLSDPAIAVLQ